MDITEREGTVLFDLLFSQASVPLVPFMHLIAWRWLAMAEGLGRGCVSAEI